MLTYVGKGYTSGFVENYDRVADRLNAGEEDIELLDGPDDICEGLLCESHAHCFNEGVVKRDETARVSVSVLLGETLAAGKRLQATPVEQAVRPHCGFRLCWRENRRTAGASSGAAAKAYSGTRVSVLSAALTVALISFGSRPDFLS